TDSVFFGSTHHPLTNIKPEDKVRAHEDSRFPSLVGLKICSEYFHCGGGRCGGFCFNTQIRRTSVPLCPSHKQRQNQRRHATKRTATATSLVSRKIQQDNRSSQVLLHDEEKAAINSVTSASFSAATTEASTAGDGDDR
ncbi:unnamed protein product, partial [Ectocarpus sp. 4 AP-2014]